MAFPPPCERLGWFRAVLDGGWKHVVYLAVQYHGLAVGALRRDGELAQLDAGGATPRRPAWSLAAELGTAS